MIGIIRSFLMVLFTVPLLICCQHSAEETPKTSAEETAGTSAPEAAWTSDIIVGSATGKFSDHGKDLNLEHNSGEISEFVLSGT